MVTHARILFVALILASHAVALGPSDRLYSIQRSTWGPLLHEIDPKTGQSLRSIPITPERIQGEGISRGNGLAVHPATGELYAILNTGGANQQRFLVTLDPGSGSATLVGEMQDQFASLAFDDTGTLYAVTGDGADVPETLYTVSLVDATATFVLTLGNGDDGEAIAFNPDDGLLYHSSGFFPGPVFESIDLDTLVVTDIPLSGINYGSAGGLAYAGNGTFSLASIGSGGFLATLTTTGVATFVEFMDHASKGIAFVPGDPIRFCGAGLVDAGCDVATDVLLFDATAGGIFRTIEAAPETPITLVLNEPPSRDGDGQPTDACVYAWLGEPEVGDVVAVPKQLGEMCFGPALLATQAPTRTWNAIGFAGKLGDDNAPGPPPVIPDQASFSLVDLPGGLGRTLTVTFQGCVEDNCTVGTIPFSVTNGLVLRIE